MPDVIKAECLRYPDKLGYTALKEWFDRFDGENYSIVETRFLPIWNAAVAQEISGDQTHPSSQIGDASVTYVLSRLPYIVGTDHATLVLLEDGPFGDGPLRQQNPETHALSTRAFLQVLQNYGRIVSAMDVYREIDAAGRRLARYMVDRPGIIGPGAKTTWTDPLDEDATGPKPP